MIQEPLNWTTVQRKVNDLVPATDNPRKISEAKLAKLIEAMQRFNVVDIPAIDHDGTLLKWHQRLKAMQAMGRGEELIDVRWPNRPLTEKERREYTLLDNQHYGEWDEELLPDFMEGLDMEELGFKDEDFKTFETRLETHEASKKPARKLEAEEDDGPGALPDAGVTVRGDVYELVSVEKGLRHRVMCGDSTSIDDLDKLMNGSKADLYLTDPPYGVSYGDKNKFLNAISRGNRIQEPIQNDHLSVTDCGQLWVDVFTLAETVMTNKASYYIFSAQGQDLMMMMMMMIDKVFSLKHCLIWVKNNHVLGRSDYNYKHEPFLYGWKKKGTHEFFGGFQTSVFEFPKPQKNDLHPTMKPIPLFAKLIENSTQEAAIVYDSFLGSGTTLIACEQLQRNCHGMELAENYCDVIVRRWLAYMEKEALPYELHLNGQPISEQRLAQLKKQA